MINKIAVYTCVTNGYDHDMSHKYDETGDVDYFYFTDGMSFPKDDRWQPVLLEEVWVPLALDPRRRAKYPKLWPYFAKEIRDYKYTVWVDGSMSILNPTFPQEIVKYIQNGWVISPHFDGRDCAYGEATIRPEKYRNEPLDEQVEHYEKEGFPHNYGLYECGVMARDMENTKVEEASRFWLGENLKWSYQDQVSLPYVLWKTGYKPDVLPQSWRDYDWLHVSAHRSEA